ncbi:TcfC E-set like domain-containing protein [Vibrio sp. AND4]|uniref:TcfC E-set like domain-containing protein n=1 Tax=Vibrio sp. AND4 TaxID=314289 RepID=UPI00015EFC58|nr:TcfC E-set like domain-containing protein [Vibrio sp. AND4]EDP60127.1 hypothetical protein AND4_01923 [Vibrio sp. AND4]
MNSSKLLRNIAIGTLTLPINVLATTVPEGFESFYQQQLRDVDVKGADGKFFSIPMLVTYDSVQIINDDASDKLMKKLVDSGLKNDEAKKILIALKNNKPNSVDCVGDLDLCVLEPKSFESFYDYHTNKLYLYLNKDMIVNKSRSVKSKAYAATHNEHIGLINSSNLYASSELDNEINLSLSDQLIAGLPYGSIHLDSYLSNDNDSSELNYGYYNIEHENLRLTAGYHQDRQRLNSTSFLLNGTQYNDLNVNLASSKNLSNSGTRTEQNLYFYSPSPATLKVYKQNRVIFQDSIAAGQGQLSYSKLPNGVYDVRVEISVGDRIISNETLRVYNATSDTLNTGEADYSVALGQFQKSSTEFENTNANNIEGNTYAQGLVAYKLSDAHTVALGSTITSGHIMNQLGFKGYLPFDSHYEIVLSTVDLQTSYISSYLNLGPFGITYENLTNETKNAFSEFIYSQSNKEQFSLSSSYILGQYIQGYSSISYYNQDLSNQNEISNWYISSGLTMPFVMDSNLDFNISINNESFLSDLEEADVTFAVNWTVPFSTLLNGKTSINFDGDGISQFSNGLETSDLISDRNTDLRMTLTNTQYKNTDDSSVNSLTAYGSHHDRHYDANAFANITDNDQTSFTASISNTQVIGRNSINFTSEKANAYVAIDTQDNIRFDEDEEINKGLLIISSDGEIDSKAYIQDQSAVKPLKEYRTTKVDLDAESVALYNSGDKSELAYTHPGSVVELESNVSRVISFVSKFKDIFGQDIDELECTGPGCLEVSNITTGIHKIDVQEGVRFSLSSKGQQCYLPPIEDAKKLNFGTNYCQPELSPMESIVLVKKNREINVMYIGGFDDIALLKPQIDLIIGQDAEMITTKLGRTTFVYLASESDLLLTQQQYQSIDSIAQYARSEVTPEQDFVLNRPVGIK